jgi:hypothetical protein
VADDTNGAAQSTLPMMDKIRPPRRLTSADVPRLADRIKDVWQTDGQHRSFGEWANSSGECNDGRIVAVLG